MGNMRAAYGLAVIISIVLGIVFFFIDGTLIWSIGFFVLAITLVLIKVMWNIAGWADNVARKLGEDDTK